MNVLLLLLRTSLILMLCCVLGACSASNQSGHDAMPEVTTKYDARTRTLVVAVGGQDRFRYGFNKGGAVNAIHDLTLSPADNLIAGSFQGETTDRVIQWTYWNECYETDRHAVGDGDPRANVTMEGSFHDAATCDVIDTPATGASKTLVFRSRIRHWFYAHLDTHGQPDFETTSTYDVLPDASLRLTRAVTRGPWPLRDVFVKTQEGKKWVKPKAKTEATTLAAVNLGSRTFSSYFEGWTPMRRTLLPKQKHGRGEFVEDGYKFWRPEDLGGWAMAYGERQAVAVVFGTGEMGNAKYHTRCVYNKTDFVGEQVNVMLPGVESDWPENSTLTQTLILVVGTPADVAARADRLVAGVPVPAISGDK